MYWSHFVNMTHPFICNFIIVCITHLISLATFQIRVWKEMWWEEKRHHPSCGGVSHRAQACHRVGLHPCWGAQVPKCCWSSGSQLWCWSGQPPYCPTWGWCQAWGWCFLRSRLHCCCCLRNRKGNLERNSLILCLWCLKLQSYYWGCQFRSYQTQTLLGISGSLTYSRWFLPGKRGRVTLHVKHLFYVPFL